MQARSRSKFLVSLFFFVALGFIAGRIWRGRWKRIQYKHKNRFGAPREWNSLVFTLQWPITTCIDWKEEDPSRTCDLPADKQLWTIHGVWPSLNGSEGPSFCNNSWAFDINAVSNILTDLTYSWPNLHGGAAEDSLWKHEWSKHGTCAALHPDLGSEKLYFGQGITWSRRYALGDVLKLNGIVPSNATYNATVIWDVLFTYLKKRPEINCIYDKQSQSHFLSELKLCVDVNLQLMDCGSSTGPSPDRLLGGCPPTIPIAYPTTATLSRFYKSKHNYESSTNTRQTTSRPYILDLLDLVYGIMWITL